MINIARTTLSSKILTVDKEYFAGIAVDAVMCLKGRTNLEPIHVIKKSGGTLKDSFLAEVRRQAVLHAHPRHGLQLHGGASSNDSDCRALF